MHVPDCKYFHSFVASAGIYSEAPAAAGHIRDVFAEYERMFGADSLTRKSGRPKGRSSSSQRHINPVRDGSLSLSNPSQQSVHDGVQDRDCTMTPGSAKVGSDGFSAGRLTNMESDDGRSSSQMEDQQRREPTERTLTQSNPPSRKRSGASEESHVLDPKRSRGSSRLSARRASEAKKTSTCSNPHEGERLRHAFPRHWWDKQWKFETSAAYPWVLST
jgi:hypothetical protein